MRTAGRWVIGTAKDGSPNGIWDSIGRLIAAMPRGEDARLGSPTDPETKWGNARLISAAPELLAALETTKAWAAKASAEGSVLAKRAYEQAERALALTREEE